MKKLFLTVGMALVAAVTLSHCGGLPSQPVNANNAAKTLGPMMTTLAALIPTNLADMDDPANLPLVGQTGVDFSVSSFAGCSPAVSGNLSDGDGDDIPVNKILNFSCLKVDTGASVISRVGRATLKDLDDGVAGLQGGYRVEFDQFSLTIEGGNTYSYDGALQYYVEGGVIHSEVEYAGRTIYQEIDGFQQDYTHTYFWDFTYDPGTGALNIDGEFRLNGKFINEINGVHHNEEGSFRITYRGTDLMTGMGCSTYKSGSLRIDDSNGAMIEIVFACTDSTLYVNGKEENWLP